MKFPVGLRLDGCVNNVTDLGVFVDLPHHHHGLIHHKDFGDRWSQAKKNIEQGQKMRVVIINNYRGKLALSLKCVNDDKLVDPTNSFNDQQDFKALTNLLTESQKLITELKPAINKNV